MKGLVHKKDFLTLAAGLILSLAPATIFSQKKYFQQNVNYIIHVTLDDTKNILKASETIEYTNNSPDELTFLYFHLWPNAYKNNSTALAKQLLENGKTDLYYAEEDEFGYIDSLDFFVDGKKTKWEYDPENIDICKLILNEPLKSRNKIVIETPFKVKIPKSGFSRLGCANQQYQITQWFPKPAVYDVNGWNQMPFLDQGEFYSEYGKFDVFISVPKNYVVAATGDLVDGEEEQKWLDENAEITRQWLDKNVTTTEPAKAIILNVDTTPKSDSSYKTLHYSQKNVHDFAWFADKTYKVLKGEIELPYSKRKVTTWVMFNKSESKLWSKSIQYINDAVYYYSLWNGEYPYNHATAVFGGLGAGGGMEYPNVTVIGPTKTDRELEVVIVHEVGHNWFYGLLGSNERVNAWMDEGINSYYENRYMETKYPGALLFENSQKSLLKIFSLNKYKRRYQNYLTYLFSARTNEDQPIATHSKDFTDFNYGAIVYAKSAVAIGYLSAYLGQDVFDEAMRSYFEEWHFRHPQPKDLKKILEEVSGRNVDWFFNEMLTTTKKVDYKIKSSKKLGDGSYDLVIKNKTNTLSPVPIYGIKNNNIVAIVWYDGFPGKQYVGFPPLDVDYFKIDYKEDVQEINRNNNKLRTHGIFKKTEPLKLQFLGSFDDPTRSQVFFTPTIGYNNYNKTLVGLALYNNITPQKKVEYLFAPMFGTGNKELAGHANMAFNFCPRGPLFQLVNIKISANRYAYNDYPFVLNYEKISPELNLKFKKRNARNPLHQNINYRYINITKQTFTGQYDQPTPVYTKDSTFLSFNEITYTLKNKQKINPYDLSLTYQQGKDMSKLFLNVNYEITFKGRNRGIDIRFFAGTFLNNTNSYPYLYRMSGQKGSQDYLFDNYYMGRNEYGNFLSKQFTETDGALKVYTPLGQTNNWLTALNIKSSLPLIRFPLRFFMDVGMIPKEGSIFNKEIFFYDGGITFSLVNDICEVYFPLFMSKDIKANLELNKISYGESIRFTLNLNMANPFKLIKDFSF